MIGFQPCLLIPMDIWRSTTMQGILGRFSGLGLRRKNGIGWRYLRYTSREKEMWVHLYILYYVIRPKTLSSWRTRSLRSEYLTEYPGKKSNISNLKSTILKLLMRLISMLGWAASTIWRPTTDIWCGVTPWGYSLSNLARSVLPLKSGGQYSGLNSGSTWHLFQKSPTKCVLGGLLVVNRIISKISSDECHHIHHVQWGTLQAGFLSGSQCWSR